MDKPLVSVIIPAYNCDNYIGEAVESCLTQTYNNVEIIVIDDGSTDNTIDILNKFSNQIQIIQQKNQGAPVARNKGLNVAKGYFIKFLDADDLLLPDTIAKQVEESLKHNESERKIVYGDLERIDAEGNLLKNKKVKHISDNTNQIAFIIENNYIVTTCPLHRKSYLLEVGGFSENLPAGQEQDLHLRLVLNGFRFKHSPTTVYYYRSYFSESRMASNNWSFKNPEFGFEQLKRLESLVKEKHEILPKPVKKALYLRHLRYAKTLIRVNNLEQAKKHLKEARKISFRPAVKNKADLLSNIIYFSYLGFGTRSLHVTKRLLNI